MTRFKCPNCGRVMKLNNTDYPIVIEGIKNLYDEWVCRDCVSIKVLDWRSS